MTKILKFCNPSLIGPVRPPKEPPNFSPAVSPEFVSLTVAIFSNQ